MIFKYNDYELLYLISEKDEDAFEIMCRKYEPLIRKRIKSFKIKKRCEEDFFQEGLNSLFIAVNKYNQFERKTFNKFFDMILQRRFIYLLRSEKDYYYNSFLIDDVEVFKESLQTYEVSYDEDYDFSKLEKKVFELKKCNLKPRDISKNLNIDVRKVYDALYRIKKKTNIND